MSTVRIEYMAKNSNNWSRISSAMNEPMAMREAQIILQRSNVKTVRVVNDQGMPLWLGSN